MFIWFVSLALSLLSVSQQLTTLRMAAKIVDVIDNGLAVIGRSAALCAL